MARVIWVVWNFGCNNEFGICKHSQRNVREPRSRGVARTWRYRFITEKEDVVHGPVAFAIYRRRNRELSRRFDKSGRNYTMNRARRTREVNGTMVEVESSRSWNPVTRFTRRRFPVRSNFIAPNFRDEFPTDIYTQTKIQSNNRTRAILKTHTKTPTPCSSSQSKIILPGQLSVANGTCSKH